MALTKTEIIVEVPSNECAAVMCDNPAGTHQVSRSLNRDVGRIYVLVDPRTGEIRYVGQTHKTLEIRLIGHLNGHGSNHRVAWIRSLKKVGLIPIIRLVQCLPLDILGQAECYWIKFLRDSGCALTNGTDGGNAPRLYATPVAIRQKRAAALVGSKRTEQTRMKMIASRRARDPQIDVNSGLKRRGIPKSPEARANMSIAQKRRYARPEERARSGKYIRTPETLAKMSASHKGLRPTDEARQKMSVARIGKKHSDETRARMRAAQQRRKAQQKLP